MTIASNLVVDMNKTLSVFLVNRVLLNMVLGNPLFKMTERWTSEILASYLGLQLYHQLVYPRLVVVSHLITNLAKVCIVTFINAIMTDGFKPMQFMVLIILTIVYSLFLEKYATTQLGKYIKNDARARAVIDSLENTILLSLDDGSRPIEMITSTIAIFLYHCGGLAVPLLNKN